MNGFERHGLTHTSASQLNMWINDPAAWTVQYLHRVRMPMGVHAARGQAIEKIVGAVLTGRAFAEASASVLTEFDDEWGTPSHEDVDGARKMIVPCAENALAALKAEKLDGKPLRQEKVLVPFTGDNWQIDCIGYTDFEWDGEAVDLKTTQRMPSSMSDDHRRQRAIYQAARGNSRVRFLYVTAKGFAWREDGDHDETIAQIKTHLGRQEAFLRLGDRDMLTRIVPVGQPSFYWRGAETIRRQVFGL